MYLKLADVAFIHYDKDYVYNTKTVLSFVFTNYLGSLLVHGSED